MIKTKRSLNTEEQVAAKALYDEFWRMHPNQKNPSDINTEEKAYFLMLKGFEKIRLMQKARKQAYSFTKPHEQDWE